MITGIRFLFLLVLEHLFCIIIQHIPPFVNTKKFTIHTFIFTISATPVWYDIR